MNFFKGTVKPELMATSEQQPPANNGQPKPGQIKFNSNFQNFEKPIYGCHLSTTASIFGSQWWPL
jgi:hypothetical protein